MGICFVITVFSAYKATKIDPTDPTYYAEKAAIEKGEHFPPMRH